MDVFPGHNDTSTCLVSMCRLQIVFKHIFWLIDGLIIGVVVVFVVTALNDTGRAVRGNIKGNLFVFNGVFGGNDGRPQVNTVQISTR